MYNRSLYGCGLRVSELIELKISDINFKESFLKVEGKGQKVRYVPLAKYTSKLIKNYIEKVRINGKKQKNTKTFYF
jgi:integrase/recombinase XerD